MKTKEQILEMIEEIKQDERMSYPTATVFANAPLALIQYGMTTKLHTLESVLGLELTKVPIKK